MVSIIIGTPETASFIEENKDLHDNAQVILVSNSSSEDERVVNMNSSEDVHQFINDFKEKSSCVGIDHIYLAPFAEPLNADVKQPHFLFPIISSCQPLFEMCHQLLALNCTAKVTILTANQSEMGEKVVRILNEKLEQLVKPSGSD